MMTGVSIEQWRGSIGLFDKKTTKQYFKGSSDFSGLFMTSCFKFLCLLKIPLVLLLNLLLIFSYCTMIVMLFPIQLSLYICMDFFIACKIHSDNEFYQLFLISVQIFLDINKIPKNVSHLIKYCILLYKSFPKTLKNAFFYMIVLKILLIIAGIEVNPGPILSLKKKIVICCLELR